MLREMAGDKKEHKRIWKKADEEVQLTALMRLRS